MEISATQASSQSDPLDPASQLLHWTALTGGTLNEVARHNDVIRRGRNAHSVATVQLLNWLEVQAMPQVPRVVAHTESHLYLRYLEGEAVLRPWPLEVKRNAWAEQLGAWLRTYHDKVQGFKLCEGAAFIRGPQQAESGMVVCHGDLGPWNFLQIDGTLTGVVDWDLAHFGSPLDDLASLALDAVPLRKSMDSTMGECASREMLRSRLEALLTSYGTSMTVARFLEHVVDYLDRLAIETRSAAAQGIAPFTQFVKRGFLDAFASDRDHIKSFWIDECSG